MTDKELKRLSRSELLYLLLEQTEENEELRGQVAELTKQLEQYQITCDNAGSIAAAALAINQVFQAADQAAQKYMQGVQDLAAREEEKVQTLLGKAQKQADEIIREAQNRAEAILAEAETCLESARKQFNVCQEIVDKIPDTLRTTRRGSK